jgi:hypothetical protein
MTSRPGEDLRLALLARCEAYCARTSMAESTFSAEVASRSFMKRLRDGGVRLETIDRVTAKLDELEAAWAAEHPAEGEHNGEGPQGEADRTPAERHRDKSPALP